LYYRLQTLYKYIATLGFIGYLPIAPGTFGTAAGFLFVLLLKSDDISLLVSSAVIFLLGLFTSHSAEKQLGKDSTHIVIDELCGYMISVIFIPKSIGYLIAAFILFRIFDIFKPPPIRAIERNVPGGAGIMLDDVLAGIYANFCMQLWRYVV
jgi:phosphatidylglycerophosphatase A